MNEYEIWRADCQDHEVEFIGKARGHTFKEACDNYALVHKDFREVQEYYAFPLVQSELIAKSQFQPGKSLKYGPLTMHETDAAWTLDGHDCAGGVTCGRVFLKSEWTRSPGPYPDSQGYWHEFIKLT